MRVLHIFPHGLGDTIQFSSVLQHLKVHKPDWQHAIAAYKGKASGMKHLAEVYDLDSETLRQQVFDHTIRYDWPENGESYVDYPATKTVKCLVELFKFEIYEKHLAYSISVGEEAQARADAYIATLPAGPFVCIHYEGNTSQEYKNLGHHEIKHVCEYLISNNITPVILDWDKRSPLPDQKTIFCPGTDNPLWMNYGTGDAETLAALIERSVAVVAIDSGPQKVALACRVPTIAVWTRHHPIHYCDCASPWVDNVIHLLPIDHAKMIRGDRRKGENYLAMNRYPHVLYRRDSLASYINNQLAKMLGLPVQPLHTLLATSYDREYYEEHKEAGLDYLGHGSWQEDYGRWFVDSLELRGKSVLDVGCACGSLACGIAKAGALVSGIDCNEYMITEGRKRWLSSTLKICDAVNCHYWKDGTFDCIHSNQVFEHLKPETVPLVLAELWRITKPGGLLVVVLDTEELFQRQKRGANEDPTHICIRSLPWWEEQCKATGWYPAPTLLSSFKEAPGSYWNFYDWDAFLCVKPYSSV